MDHLRSRLLNLAFQLLYDRFVLFHELAGMIVFGAAWAERRLVCLDGFQGDPLILDLGAGEGRLILAGKNRGLSIVGVDPSPSMRKAAGGRGVNVLPGSSFRIPYADDTVDAVVSTYPGRWILDDRTWSEINRVLGPTGEARILIGGTYERGRGASLRGWISRLAYGQSTLTTVDIQPATDRGFSIETMHISDAWGKAVFVRASRSEG